METHAIGTLDLQHVNVKLFVDGGLAVDPGRFIEVFHGWIRENPVQEMLIDVADYRHVPSGPGVVLIGHQADYSMDNTAGRWGLRYNRKARFPGTNTARFTQALRAAARACAKLETEFSSEGPLRFNRREFALFINDRALAPNTPETYAAAKPALEMFLRSTFPGTEFRLEHDANPRHRFGVSITFARPFELKALAAGAAS